MSANNTAILNALTTAVLTSISDDVLQAEIKRRGLNVSDSLQSTLDYVAREVAAYKDGGTQGRLVEIAQLIPDDLLWQAIEDNDGIGAKWANENPIEALEHIDEGDLEDYISQWVRDNMSEVVSNMDMDSLMNELTRHQKCDLLVALAQAADF